MPAPITHIVLALNALTTSLFTRHDKKAFIQGTSFPDIRYLAHTPRKQTHPPVTWERVIQEQSSFKAGMLFHIFVDQQHSAFMEHQSAFNALLDQLPQPHSLITKQAEDILFFQHTTCDWREIQRLLNTPVTDAHTKGIPSNLVTKWYKHLKRYISRHWWQNKFRGWFLWRLLLRKNITSFTKQNALRLKNSTDCINTIQDLCKNPTMKELTIDFYNDFIARFLQT